MTWSKRDREFTFAKNDACAVRVLQETGLFSRRADLVLMVD